MNRHDHRGTGVTTTQLRSAPRDAVFVAVSHTGKRYVADLARGLGRLDLRIVAPEDFDTGRLRGVRLTGLVLDHAVVLTRRQREEYEQLKGRVRAP